MNEVRYSDRALDDIDRLSEFLLEMDPAEASATADILLDALAVLSHSPEIGRRVRGGNRELVISRGNTGYLALYHFQPGPGRILVLAIRHQREGGYKSP